MRRRAAPTGLAGRGIRRLPDVVRVHAADRPDAIALECEGRNLTFIEWYERSATVAAALTDLGVGAGERVAVLARNGLPIFELTMGAALLNAVAVQVNWRLAALEVARIVADSEARVLVVAEEFAPTVEQIEDEMQSGASPVRTIVVIGKHPRWASYEDWLAAAKPEDPGLESSGTDVAMQLYTSGTTGLPKGAMLTHDNVFSFVGANRWFDFRPGDSVNLVMMPLFHIGGLGWSTVGLTFGCRTVVLPDVDVSKAIEAVRAGVTHVFLVPAVLQGLLALPGLRRSDFASLRKLVYGASPIAESVLVRAIELIGCDLIQLYGLTETTGAITQLLPEEHDPKHRPELLRSCGRPYPWVDLRVVDPATERDVGSGEVGELWVRSPQVMAGYWHNRAATDEVLLPDGWLRTGDAGYRDPDGYLYLYDRVKDMIVSGAENVYPAEVENVLMDHPDVADVAVIGVPDQTWGEAVKAIVVPAGHSSPEPADLIAFCHTRLAGYKCPKSVDFAEALPRNPSGKLLKRELRRPYWEGLGRMIG
jgi:long-chain acyl-CoA synthetase